MITIEPMNGLRGCTANCGTCPPSIKTLRGSRDAMDAFIKRLVALCEEGHASYIFSPTGNVDQLFSWTKKYGVTMPEDIVTIAGFPETTTETIRQVYDGMTRQFPKAFLTIGVVEKGITVSATHRDSIYAMIDAFTESSLSSLLINLPNNYIAPELFAQSQKQFWESDEDLFGKVRERYGIQGRPLQVFAFNDQKHVRMYRSNAEFIFSKRKQLHISRRVISPIEAPGYNWKLFRESAKDVSTRLRKELHTPGFVEDGYFSPAPFGVRFQHQSFDPANPFLWFSYAEINKMLDDCEVGLFSMNNFFEKIALHIEAGLHLKLEDHISATDEASIIKAAELRSALIYHK